jgi:hypothetical protein
MIKKCKDKHSYCCKDFSDAMVIPTHRNLRFDDDGILYLTIGYAVVFEGTGTLEQAVIFCPFCGTRLQDEEEIRRKQSQQNHDLNN